MERLSKGRIARWHCLLVLLLLVGSGLYTGYPFNAAAQGTAITVTTAADELNSDGDCSLREAVQAANTNAAVDGCAAGTAGSDTITLPAGLFPLALEGTGEDANATGDLDITEDVTLTGAGAEQTILDGGDIDRVLHIGAGVTASITGVTIQHGNAPGESGTGGGVFNQGILVLSDSIVRENRAEVSGGGIYSHEDLKLINTSVISNTANGSAGIAAVGQADIIRSEIRGNSTVPYLSDTPNVGGGAVFLGDITITDSTISDNTANEGVGGLGVISSNLTITDSIIRNNTANSSGGAGIMNIRSTTLIEDSTISGNTSNENGSGIANFGVLEVRRSTISGNTSMWGGAGILNALEMRLVDSVVAENVAVADGGGIRNEFEATMTIVRTSLEHNRAEDTKNGLGGGISNLGTLHIIESTLRDNTAVSGGAILNAGTTMIITASEVLSNSASFGSGGIANSGIMKMVETTVRNNQTDGYAGGIANTRVCGVPEGEEAEEVCVAVPAVPRLDIIDSIISDNTAALGCAGILNDAELSVSNAHISDNVAGPKYGGGVCNLSFVSEGSPTLTPFTPTITIHHTTINDNRVAGSGGGLFNEGEVALEHSTIYSNTAGTNGGGIANWLVCDRDENEDCAANPITPTLTIITSTISNNTARNEQGGGIDSLGVLTITNSLIQGNTTSNGSGGGIRNASNTMRLNNVTVSNNVANIAGGGIFVESGSAAALGNTTISHNRLTGADAQGAGIFSNGIVHSWNSIVANHPDGGDCANPQGTIASLYGNIASDSTCPFTATMDLQATDPLLGDLQDNGGPTLTRALQPGSPAIDAARNSTCPPYDQRGFSRAVDGDEDGVVQCDSGAFEYAATADLAITDLPPLPEPTAPVTPENAISTGGGSITITNGLVTFPPGAVEETIIITYTELPTDTIAPITTTHQVLRAFRLEARTSDGQAVYQFAEPYSINLSYTAEALSTAGMSAETLELFFWEREAGTWVKVAPSERCARCGAVVDSSRREVVVVLDHLTDFALVGQAAPQPLDTTDATDESGTNRGTQDAMYLPLVMGQ